MKAKNFKTYVFIVLLVVFIVLVLMPEKNKAVTVVYGKFAPRSGGGFVCFCPNGDNSCCCALVDPSTP